MNHSIYSADRTTHLKVVVVALIAGIAIAGFGISARMNSDAGYTQTARVVKAGQPVAISSANSNMYAGHFTSPQSEALMKNARPHGRFSLSGFCYFAGGGTVSISLPVNTIGPVATPVGEPPSGSSVT
eukprot:gene38631-52192_t